MEQAGPFGRIQHDLAGQFQHGALNACKTILCLCFLCFPLFRRFKQLSLYLDRTSTWRELCGVHASEHKSSPISVVKSVMLEVLSWR